jgi:hypothetical protein
LEAKVIENPEIFVVEQLAVKFVHKHMHVLGGAELLKGQFHQLDAAGKRVWQPLKLGSGQFRQKGILLDSVYLSSPQTSQLSGKQAKAAAPFDTHRTPDQFCVRSEQGAISPSALRIIVDGNKRQEVIDFTKSVGRKVVEDIHGNNEAGNKSRSGFCPEEFGERIVIL